MIFNIFYAMTLDEVFYVFITSSNLEHGTVSRIKRFHRGSNDTERDIGAKVCCTKTEVHNPIVKSNTDGTF